MIPTSPSNICKVLDKLHMLWMGIWSHREAMSTTCICQNLGSLLKSFTAGQQTTPLCSGWGSNPATSWNGSNIPPNICWKDLDKLHMLWMGIWCHILPITVTNT
jgi:hypothetical protein